MKQSDADFVQRILKDAKSGKLQLPSPPEFAQDLHTAIEDESRDAAYVARIIQYDPGLTTRVIQVANSALYRGHKKVTSCKEAVTRIGMSTMRHLIFTFTLNNAFSAKSSQVKALMSHVWALSRETAVMCFIIASKTPGMDPHRALMAGLIHNVGKLPFLQYVDEYSSIIESEKRMQFMLEKLKGPLGDFVLRSWKFDDELAAVPTAACDWMRDPAPIADYADVVNIARAYINVGKPPEPNQSAFPKLFELPAFKKIPLCQLGPDECMQTLADAELEMGVVKALL